MPPVPKYLLLLLCPLLAQAEVYHVDVKGNDDQGAGSNERPWRTIQRALDECEAGDTVLAHPGVYAERVEFNNSGSASKGWISLQGENGATISGKGVPGQQLIRAENQSYLRIQNLDLVDNTNKKESAAIMIEGGGSHYEIRNCRIARCKGLNAIGIGFYGSKSELPLSDIVIDGNSITDCQPAPSEALVLNGNVMKFLVSNNTITNVNNIGIDFIGGEPDLVKDTTKVARQGICRGNRVENARSSYGDGYAAGIYVDGGKDITIEDNVVTQSDLGIEVGAENRGTVASGIVVRRNVIFKNDKAGLVFGGYDTKRGRVRDCIFEGNQFYQNTQHAKPQGELWIQHASGNTVRDNFFWVTEKKPMALIVRGAGENTVDGNTWFTTSGEESLRYQVGEAHGTTFTTWQSTTSWDAKGKFERWEFTEPSKDHTALR
jgi:parallel beta-helix repeat protein